MPSVPAFSELRVPATEPNAQHTQRVVMRTLSPSCSIHTRRQDGKEEHTLRWNDTALYCDTESGLQEGFQSLHDVQRSGNSDVKPGDSVKVRSSQMAWQVMHVDEIHIDGVVARNCRSETWLPHAQYRHTWVRTVETKPEAMTKVDDDSSQHSGSASFSSRWTIPPDAHDWQDIVDKGAQSNDENVSRQYENALASLQTLAEFLGLDRGVHVHRVQRAAREAREKFEPSAVFLQKALLAFGPYVRNTWGCRLEAENEVWSQSIVGARCRNVEKDVAALQSALESAT